MSDVNVEVELELTNNSSVDIAEVMDGYTAEQARQYKVEAEDAAARALESQHLAEAWAVSDIEPAGEGTRSSKTWSDVSRQWAESETEPDNVDGARSSKTWCNTAQEWAESETAPDGIVDARSSKIWADVARQWAESESEPDGVTWAYSSKTWAEASAKSAGQSAQSAAEALASQKASADSAAEALASQKESANQATIAGQHASDAADKLAQMQIDLKVKADTNNAVLTGTPTAPTPSANADVSQIANVEYVKDRIADLVNGSSASLDTLKELADALGDDPNFSQTVMDAIGKKLDATATAVAAVKDGDGNTITETYATKAEIDSSDAALAAVAKSGSYNDLLNKPVIPSKTSQLTNDSNYVATDANGNLTLSGTLTATKVYNAVYNDYAEFFPRGELTEVGDIIALDETSALEKYVKATSESKCVVGVHSEEFAQIIGGNGVEKGEDMMKVNLPNFIPVALAGRVHVRFMGRAEIGAFVVPSSNPGVGIMAVDGDDLSRAVGQIVKADKGQNLRLIKIIVRRL